MKKIRVYFHEDVIDVFKTIEIEASSREDFESKLDEFQEIVLLEAENAGVELAGINYSLPKEW